MHCEVKVPADVNKKWGLSRDFTQAYQTLMEDARKELGYDAGIPSTDEAADQQ